MHSFVYLQVSLVQSAWESTLAPCWMSVWLIFVGKVFFTSCTVKRIKQEIFQCGLKEYSRSEVLSLWGEAGIYSPIAWAGKSSSQLLLSPFWSDLCVLKLFCWGSGCIPVQSTSSGLYTAAGIFTEIPAPVGFFYVHRERKTYSNWHDHYLQDYFLWRLSNTWIFTCLFSDLLGLKVNIQKSHLIPSSSLDFTGLQVN